MHNLTVSCISLVLLRQNISEGFRMCSHMVIPTSHPVNIFYCSRRNIREVIVSIRPKNHAIVSLKVVSRKRRRKCTLKSYDRFTNS